MEDQIFGDLQNRLRAGLSDDEISKIAMATRASFMAQFQSAGAYGGTPWAPLAESTLRKRRGSSAQILVDTGTLIDSLTVPGAPHQIVERVGAWEVEVGTDLFYAALHQSGTRNMPARELVTDEMVEQEADDVAESIADFVLGTGEEEQSGLAAELEDIADVAGDIIGGLL